MNMIKRYFNVLLFIFSFCFILSALSSGNLYADTLSDDENQVVESDFNFKSEIYTTIVGRQFVPAIEINTEKQIEPVLDCDSFDADIDGYSMTFYASGVYEIYLTCGEITHSATVNVKPDKITDFTLSKDNYENYLEWNYDDYNISYVNVYRSIERDKGYKLLDSSYSYYYGDYDIKPGVRYYYKLQPVFKSGEIKLKGDFSKILSAIKKVGKIKISSIKAKKANAITVEWNELDGIDGYYLYRSDNKKNKYKIVKTISNKSGDNYESYYFFNEPATKTYTNTKLKIGTKYYYKVAAFVKVGNKKIVVATSAVKSEYARPGIVNVKSAVSDKKNTNTIKWKKTKNASGYIIYTSNKYNGKYKKIKTITNNKTFKFTHKKLTNGKLYFYKIVAYKKVKGKKIQGVESEPIEKYCSYYSYSNESYSSKYNRIFGNRKYGYYNSNEEALKNMTTIKIKTWDIDSRGNKYTVNRWVTVHKNIAESVKMLFNDLYNSKERFPIHDIGCFSWRTGNPSSEHCIGLAFDINANENYMIDDGKILSGSLWNPKQNPYSIPLKCELVSIFEKYGFTRGFWGNRKDYMHFSYFGT